MAGDISNHSISDITGLEPLSPIVSNTHTYPYPGSAFSPFPYRHHQHGSVATDIQHLIAADDTDNDKLKMVCPKKIIYIIPPLDIISFK